MHRRGNLYALIHNDPELNTNLLKQSESKRFAPFADIIFELFHRLDAAAANRRMLGIRADVRFPMPAALAFLAVGLCNTECSESAFVRTFRFQVAKHSTVLASNSLIAMTWLSELRHCAIVRTFASKALPISFAWRAFSNSGKSSFAQLQTSLPFRDFDSGQCETCSACQFAS